MANFRFRHCACALSIKLDKSLATHAANRFMIRESVNTGIGRAMANGVKFGPSNRKDGRGAQIGAWGKLSSQHQRSQGSLPTLRVRVRGMRLKKTIKIPAKDVHKSSPQKPSFQDRAPVNPTFRSARAPHNSFRLAIERISAHFVHRS